MILFLLITLTLGWLLLRRIAPISWPLLSALPLSLGLGYGAIGFINFFILLVFNQFNPLVLFTSLLSALGLLIFLNKPLRANWLPLKPAKPIDYLPLIPTLFIGALVAVAASHFPQGGWDAWSCWNFKARFIFEAHGRWRDMLDPALWRTNNQYPLFWPLINATAYYFTGGYQAMVGQINSVVLTLAMTLLLSQSIFTLTKNKFNALLLPMLGLSIPLVIILLASQYSDLPVAFYTLVVVVCFLLRRQIPSLVIVAALSLGALSFCKTEGLVASLILTGLWLWHIKPQQRLNFCWPLAIAFLPTVIFQLTMAPHNSAFVNGLTSAAKPLDINRLIVVGAYPFFEMINFKWLGFWLLVVITAGVHYKRILDAKWRIIPIFLSIYLSIVLAYYAINTFFPIAWWMQTTLHRILFTLIPTILLWLGLLI